MGTPAAFFDLDRTLIRGASGPVLSDALRHVGLISGRPLPGEGLVFRFFDVVGETLPAMLLTRQGARMATGWKQADAQAAGRLAVDGLMAIVQPFAVGLIADHRAHGRPVVMATTSPYDLVSPLADALGLDDVIATRYGVTGTGHYDGTFDGEFVWGAGKLAAIRHWARAHGVDVDRSWAYSDSIYDSFLLGAVAHPHAVNPDPRLRAMAVARRWPTIHLDVPPGVPKLAGVEPQQVALQVARNAKLAIAPYARFDVEGADNIPVEGPAIVVANHRSYFDPIAVGVTMAERGRPVRFLGKKEVFDAPVVGDMARAMGGIRVERGTGSDEPLREAAAALAAGEMVAIMPQGTIPRGRAFFDPELKGRWGAAKLAAMSGAPVLPIGLWGTEQVWPRNSRVPMMWNVLNPPTVRATIGEPFHVGGHDADVDTTRIMSAISALLPPEARVAREPTPEELARAYPAGHTAETDAEHEVGRRPGTD
jgi:putative phosphoserine phosphatase/1-acylglycerol-3-phosphate O-acyltransferase